MYRMDHLGEIRTALALSTSRARPLLHLCHHAPPWSVRLPLQSGRQTRELAKQNGAYAWCVKGDTSGEDLNRAIQHAIESVGQMSTQAQ